MLNLNYSYNSFFLFFFLFISFSLICSSIMVIVSKDIIFSLIYLIASFLFGSILMILMRSEFLALVIIIIYIGALTMLFLFVIMMLDIQKNKSEGSLSITEIFAVLSAFFFIISILFYPFFFSPVVKRGLPYDFEVSNSLDDRLTGRDFIDDSWESSFSGCGPAGCDASDYISKEYSPTEDHALVTYSVEYDWPSWRTVRNGMDLLGYLPEQRKEISPYNLHDVDHINFSLYTNHSIFLIIISLIFLVAMIGSITLTSGYFERKPAKIKKNKKTNESCSLCSRIDDSFLSVIKPIKRAFDSLRKT